MARSQKSDRNPLHTIRVLGLAEAIGLVSGLLMHIAAARHLAPIDYGRFTVLIVIEICLLILTSGGVPHALRRLVSVSADNLPEAFRWAMRVQLPLGVGLALLLAMGAEPLGVMLGDGGLTAPLRFLSLDVAIRCGLMESYLALLNGARRHTWQGYVVATFFLTRLGGVTVAVTLNESLTGAVLGMISASIIATILAMSFVLWLRSHVLDAPDKQFASQALAWIRLAPGYEILVALVVAANLWLVKARVPDPILVGGYAACFMMAQAISALGRALIGSTFAPLAATFSEDSTDRAYEIVSQATRAMTWLLVPVCAIVIIRGEAIIGLLYGMNYRGSGDLAGVLFIGASGMSASYFFGGVLGAAGRLSVRLYIMVLLTTASILITLAIIPSAGTIGAAWSLLITGTVSATVTAWFVRTLVGPFIPWSCIIRTMGAASVMTALLLLVGSPRGGIYIICDLIVGLLSYAGVLVYLGELDR